MSSCPTHCNRKTDCVLSFAAELLCIYKISGSTFSVFAVGWEKCFSSFLKVRDFQDHDPVWVWPSPVTEDTFIWLWGGSDQLRGCTCACLMPLAMTQCYGEHMLGPGHEQVMKRMTRKGQRLHCICVWQVMLRFPEPGVTCVWVFRRMRAGPGEPGGCTPRLAVIGTNLVSCKWKIYNFILGFSS